VTRVITVGREHGSGGKEIAGRVAQSLGWTLVDKQVVEEVARLARISPEEAEAFDERVNPWIIRLVRGLWSGAPEGWSGAAADAIPDADRIARLTRRVILDAAAQGSCVILGRGAQCALHEAPGVFRVFVYAPESARLARLKARLPSDADAAAELERTDRERAAYVRHYYGCEWANRDCFDVLVNSRVGVRRSVRTILGAAGLAEPPR
jgi:CMP/dCMP kinase